MKKINIGIVAHVDAGKTTLSESMLYLTGALRRKGRVDHQDAFLDFNKQERNRGITIYTKQAVMKWKDAEITLIDTPGHVDFSAEMERVLQILDYAILLINASDGVQAHTETIWKLLRHYHVPVFIFVNKMDIAHQNKDAICKELQQKLSGACVDMTIRNTACYEAMAMCEDTLLEEYMETQKISTRHIQGAILNQQIIPCYFGSALKMDGIEVLLDALCQDTIAPVYSETFEAIVYKITRDEQGNRLAHMKITGGSLKVKERLHESDKVDQLRRYHGTKYELLQEATAGMVCAVKGCDSLQAGDHIGKQPTTVKPQLQAYMEYRMILLEGCDAFSMLASLRQLAEEEPQLHVRYIESLQEIRVSFMGEVQIEVFQQLIKERFRLSVQFDEGTILYKETIQSAVEGIGHFEPLRHYAEVHVLLEPGPRNSGLSFASDCSTSVLDAHWQKAVLALLKEKEHIGVLCGMPITDIKMTLLCGKAHEKHTEGGDFRQATYRAVRQGLMQADCILLEPYVCFELEIPSETISRAIFDLEGMHAIFQMQDSAEEMTRIDGKAPAASMQHYAQNVLSYTKGKGRLSCTWGGYEPCLDQQRVVEECKYQSEADIENPTGSIFCAHGAGFFVPWNEVSQHMHLHSDWEKAQRRIEVTTPTKSYQDEDLMSIYERTYGKIKQRTQPQTIAAKEYQPQDMRPLLKECLLVDGYNMIHAWPKLKALADDQQMDAAREQLIHALCSYQGYKKCELILVFDAYQVMEGTGDLQKRDQIYVVYTKQAQTADMYIERATHELASKYRVTVATSDGMEQLITMGQGASRMSSRQLIKEMEHTHQASQEYVQRQKQHRTYLLETIRDYEEDEQDV